MDKFKNYLKDTEIQQKYEQAKDAFIKDVTNIYGEEKVDSWLKTQNKDDLLK